MPTTSLTVFEGSARPTTFVSHFDGTTRVSDLCQRAGQRFGKPVGQSFVVKAVLADGIRTTCAPDALVALIVRDRDVSFELTIPTQADQFNTSHEDAKQRLISVREQLRTQRERRESRDSNALVSSVSRVAASLPTGARLASLGHLTPPTNIKMTSAAENNSTVEQVHSPTTDLQQSLRAKLEEKKRQLRELRGTVGLQNRTSNGAAIEDAVPNNNLGDGHRAVTASELIREAGSRSDRMDNNSGPFSQTSSFATMDAPADRTRLASVADTATTLTTNPNIISVLIQQQDTLLPRIVTEESGVTDANQKVSAGSWATMQSGQSDSVDHFRAEEMVKSTDNYSDLAAPVSRPTVATKTATTTLSPHEQAGTQTVAMAQTATAAVPMKIPKMLEGDADDVAAKEGVAFTAQTRQTEDAQDNPNTDFSAMVPGTEGMGPPTSEAGFQSNTDTTQQDVTQNKPQFSTTVTTTLQHQHQEGLLVSRHNTFPNGLVSASATERKSKSNSSDVTSDTSASNNSCTLDSCQSAYFGGFPLHLVETKAPQYHHHLHQHHNHEKAPKISPETSLSPDHQPEHENCEHSTTTSTQQQTTSDGWRRRRLTGGVLRNIDPVPVNSLENIKPSMMERGSPTDGHSEMTATTREKSDRQRSDVVSVVSSVSEYNTEMLARNAASLDEADSVTSRAISLLSRIYGPNHQIVRAFSSRATLSVSMARVLMLDQDDTRSTTFVSPPDVGFSL